MNDKLKKNFKIMIDNKPFDWESQFIKGSEIRTLGEIPENYVIYLKINGPGEDELIGNDYQVDLSQPGREHFVTKEMPLQFDIIVNGRNKTWLGKTISYIEVVKLAFENYVDNGSNSYSVTYDKGPKANPAGSMVEGVFVYLQNKMVFNVTATIKS
jgi:hypothetical protein